ncbi:hypothetical protein BVRB_7g177530 [Beta vulgaris subsp. vulgaris]|uniref:Peroxidase n=1 Tax=Beta vulgaris subsp. vulgaris TaxID=3555 RepID=A0A0J8B877_BETVV|nr:hypothetical protein BVRB_7g177530 [Beta vulgaris subsp. vulgaris]
MRCNSPSTVLALGLMLLTLVSQCHGKLYVGYYNGKCWKYNVEEIIFNVVKAKYMKDPTIVAGLVRLHFHDCIVRGCDASVLLDGPKSEKAAAPNQSLKSFDVVDAAKAAVEEYCPGVVSCADVLTIAARTSIFLAGEYMPARDAINLFDSKGISKEDFVVLLGGGHSIGTVHCDKFKHRLYNFHNTGKPDARINNGMLYTLRKICPKKSYSNNKLYFDYNPRSHYRVDNGFMKHLLFNHGLLEVDANIATSPLTNSIVKKLAYAPGYFDNKFGPAMVKMGRIGVLTGNHGEVRKYCGAVNHHKY